MWESARGKREEIIYIETPGSSNSERINDSPTLCADDALYKVFRKKLCLFPINCMQSIPRLHLSERSMQIFQYNASVQSLLLSGQFSERTNDEGGWQDTENS